MKDFIDVTIVKNHFFQNNRLQLHITRTHLGISKYKCDRCDKSYKANAQLQIHIKNVHEVGTYSAECDICKQVFATESKLRYHKTYKH